MAAIPDADALLSALMSSDGNIRLEAESTWKDMKWRVPDEVVELTCGVLGRREAGTEGLRAMAAVLLRTLFDFRSNLWQRVQPQTKTGVKNALVAHLAEEPVAHIRRKLTYAIGQVAGVSASESEWPELMALTIALCSSEQRSPELKVVGLDLVNILAEFCPGSLAPHEGGLLQMFDACLEDGDAGVRVSALKACCSFLQDLRGGSRTPQDGSLAVKLVGVLQATASAGDEESLRDALETLNVAAAKQPWFLVGPGGCALNVLGEALFSLAASSALEMATRELSLELITTLFESVPSVARDKGANMVQAVVTLAINMLAQRPEAEDGQRSDEDDLAVWLSKAGKEDDDEDELGTMAASALSRIAVALGGQTVLSSALSVCSEFLGDASNWRRRKTGLLTLLLIGEGCGEDMASRGLLPQIVLGSVASGIGDADPRVRQAGLGCLSQLTEDFRDWNGGGGHGEDKESKDKGEGPSQGSFQETFHDQLLPLLVQSLGGPNANIPRVQAVAASALITFCNPDRMRPEWLYASGKVLLESLRDLLRASPSIVVREEALTAAGCVAQVLGPDFCSFYSIFMPLAKEILASTTPAENHGTDTLRGKAMEAIALMGAAAGLEAFRDDAHQVIKILISEQKAACRDPSNPQSTYALNSLTRMAGVLGAEFLPYLDDAVAPLLQGLSLDAEIKVSSVTSGMSTAREELEEAGLTPLEMDVRGIGRQLFGINTSLMQAKESACRVLFQYTEDLGAAFAAYASRTLAVVLPNLSPRNAVEVQVVSAAIVPRLVGMASRRAAAAAEHAGENASVGAAGGAAVALATEAQAMLVASMQSLCEVISRIEGNQGEELGMAVDMEPACIAADSLSALLMQHCMPKKPSPVSLTPVVETGVVAVLRNAARASMRRCEARAAADLGTNADGDRALAGLTGAVDSAEREEQNAWEEDLLASSVDGIGWIIKSRRESFLPTFDAMLKPFVLPLLQLPLPHLAVSMPPSQLSFGLCLSIDILEHCGDGGRRSIFGALMPVLFQGCADGTPSSIRQACAYGLGVAADHGGEEFDAYSAEAFRLLLGLVEQGRRVVEEDMEEDYDVISCVTDNAVSAALRMVCSRIDPIVASFSGEGAKPAAAAATTVDDCLTPAVGILLRMLPLRSDVIEARDCHRRVVDILCCGNRVLMNRERGDGDVGIGYVPELVRALAGMMAYQPSPEEIIAAAGGSVSGRKKRVDEEREEEMYWERQLVDKDTRRRAEHAVETLRTRFPDAFEHAWASLGEDMQCALMTPTSSIHPRGRGL